MINLKIDPEFQSQIPPLTDDEFKQLEENILKEGKLISPLIVWGNTLVDGHNRYEIVQEHPEISFSTMPLRFESREEVLAYVEILLWVISAFFASSSCVIPALARASFKRAENFVVPICNTSRFIVSRHESNHNIKNQNSEYFISEQKS